MASITDREQKAHALTPEEGQDPLDKQARRYLGISGTEFARKWDGGAFDDNPDRPEVMRVAMLIHLGR